MGVKAKGAGRLTVLVGIGLGVAAWALGAAPLPPTAAPVYGVLAELFAAISVILAWRFRRGRLALAAIAIATANTLLRGPLAGQLESGGGSGLAALALLLPPNLALLSLLPERPLASRAGLVHLGVLLAQPWLVARLLAALDDAPKAGWADLLLAREASLLALLIALAFALLAFAVRRGAFEGGMLPALATSAAALLAGQPPRPALLLAAAQLALLFAAVEDSYRLAFHDQLTGLRGRRALDDALRSLAGSYAIAMIDVDHFKRFNDRWGHARGDQALRMVAEELRAVGAGGNAFRYGGEEFAIVFSGLRPAQAEAAVEAVRQAIAERRFTIRAPDRPRARPETPRPPKRPPREARVTVSVGLAGPTARRPTPAEVLRAADRALYRAKHKGRNRVVRV